MADIQKKIAEAQVRFTEEEKHKTGPKQDQEKNLALASTFLKTAVASMAHNVVQLNRNLENVIQQREETPYREGENDMAKRVKLSIPNEYGGGWATGATKEEATAQLLKRCGVTRQSVNQNIPLYSDYAQRWYDLAWKPKENGVKNSWKDPKRAIEESKLYFQGQRLDEITKSKIQEYLNSLAQRGLAKSTIEKRLIAVRGVLEMAIDDGLLSKNAATSKKLDCGDKVTERLPLTDEEVASIWKSIHIIPDSKDQLKILLPMFLGLRRGETLALQWKDIDWNSETVNITKALHFKNGKAVTGNPKSKAGFRTIPIPPLLLDFLRPLKPEDENEYLASNGEKEYDCHYKRSWDKMIELLQSKTSIQKFTAHQLRHTYTTHIIVNNNVDPKTAQTILGHSSADITLQVYTHARKKKIEGVWKDSTSPYGKLLTQSEQRTEHSDVA